MLVPALGRGQRLIAHEQHKPQRYVEYHNVADASITALRAAKHFEDAPDFSSGVISSGYVGSAEYTFTGLQTGKLYYARVKAKNMEGMETAYNYPGSIPTVPGPASGFAGTSRSSVSIEVIILEMT